MERLQLSQKWVRAQCQSSTENKSRCAVNTAHNAECFFHHQRTASTSCHSFEFGYARLNASAIVGVSSPFFFRNSTLRAVGVETTRASLRKLSACDIEASLKAAGAAGAAAGEAGAAGGGAVDMGTAGCWSAAAAPRPAAAMKKRWRSKNHACLDVACSKHPPVGRSRRGVRFRNSSNLAPVQPVTHLIATA